MAPSARPTATPDVDAANKPTDAQSVWGQLLKPGSNDQDDDNSSPKRYLVCFLQSQSYAYWDIYEDEENQVGLIARKGEVYDDRNRAFNESSYCLAAYTLRAFGNFDDMITIAGPYLNKAQVEATFDALAKQTNPGDEIVVFWTGHGMKLATDDDGDERDISDEGNQTGGQSADVDEALVLFDTILAVDEEAALPDQWARETSVVDDDLAKYFEKLKGRSVVAYFEVCHAGGLAVLSELAGASNAPTSRNLFGEKITPPVAKTWAELKDPKVDSTDDLLKLAGAQFALQAWPLPTRESNAARNGFDPFRGKPRQVSMPNVEKLLDEAERPSTSRPARRAENSRPNNASLEALIRAGESKALSDVAAGKSGFSKDLSRESLEHLAVVFTSLSDESSWCGHLMRDDEGDYYISSANPCAFSIFVAFNCVTEAKEKLDFATFAQFVSAFVKNDMELRNEYWRKRGDERESQTPVFLTNWEDAILYEPTWEPYYDEQWEQGGEKWRTEE